MGINPFAPISDAIRTAREAAETARYMGKGRTIKGDGHSNQDAQRQAQEAMQKAIRDAAAVNRRAEQLVGQYRRAENLEKSRLGLAERGYRNAKRAAGKAAEELERYDRDVSRGNRTADSSLRSRLVNTQKSTATDMLKAESLLAGCRRAHRAARDNHDRAKQALRKLERDLRT